MLKCYITEDYLKGFAPEINNYLWSGETNFNSLFTVAKEKVFDDLVKAGLSVKKLMPELTLRDSGTSISTSVNETAVIDDKINRLRFVCECVVFTGTEEVVVTLQGSNDNSSFNDITTLTFSAIGILDTKFFDTYTYYRVNADASNVGAFDYTAFLVNTKYDQLFEYKILEMIFKNVKRKADDGFQNKASEYEAMYNEAFNKIRPVLV